MLTHWPLLIEDTYCEMVGSHSSNHISSASLSWYWTRLGLCFCRWAQKGLSSLAAFLAAVVILNAFLVRRNQSVYRCKTLPLQDSATAFFLSIFYSLCIDFVFSSLLTELHKHLVDILVFKSLSVIRRCRSGQVVTSHRETSLLPNSLHFAKESQTVPTICVVSIYLQPRSRRELNGANLN